MKRTVWLLAALAPLALLMPQRAWALRCGTQIVKQGETAAQVPAWGETWFYPVDGSQRARAVQLQAGRVVDVQIVN